jgi:hypothetical protein
MARPVDVHRDQAYQAILDGTRIDDEQGVDV